MIRSCSLPINKTEELGFKIKKSIYICCNILFIYEEKPVRKKLGPEPVVKRPP